MEFVTAVSGKEVLAVKRESKSSAFIGKLVTAAFLLLGFQMLTQSCGSRVEELTENSDTLKGAMIQELAETASRALYSTYMSGLAVSLEGDHETFWLLQEQIDSVLPFYGYLTEGLQGGAYGDGLWEILRAEADDEGSLSLNSIESGDGLGVELGHDLTDSSAESTLEELLRAENEAAMQMRQESAQGLFSDFVPHTRQIRVDLAALESYEALLKEFYTIDSNTMAGSDQLDVNKLTAKDMTIDKNSDGPQILIYHTHSQEGFVDSVPGDDSTNIQGVGERLAQILRDTYGYQVIHHTGEYDVEGRNDAYANALPAIEQILEENPSIQVVIDLHRDEMPEKTRLVMDLDGRPTARFMFFNGLSRTKTTGNIAYLYNENLDDNLAFSFQMQLKAAEYYPGLTRKIYLKGYRYNMHLASRYLLIELGAQNNTLEEAMNACNPLAHILDLVLSGE
ncbi:MAG: stage II sporulation protein P [Acetatifactor sp.]|nr:stage II sporulation protein P [Acetatifactor sp.]